MKFYRITAKTQHVRGCITRRNEETSKHKELTTPHNEVTTAHNEATTLHNDE